MFLWSLCVVLFVTRFALPLSVERWQRRQWNLDREDFKNLEALAREVRDDYVQQRFDTAADEQERYAIVRQYDLQVRLQLVGVHVPFDGSGVNLFDAMARLIQLMQRDDLKTARELYPLG